MIRVAGFLLACACLLGCKTENDNRCINGDVIGDGGMGGSSSSSGGAGPGGFGGIGGAPIICPPSECDAADAKIGKADCDDGDPDTVDRCVAQCGGLCVNIPGQCDGLDEIPIQAAQCDDGNECTDGRCSGKNVCVQLPFSGGTCGSGGTCVDGVCVVP